MRVKAQVGLLCHYFKEFHDHRVRGESRYAVERLAQLTIQALLDLGALVAVLEGGGPKPETYRELAGFLADRLGLDQDQRRFLEQAAGFRNLLVHGYARLDPQLEEAAFRELEARLPAILEMMEKFLAKIRDDPVGAVGHRLKGVFERWGVRFAYLYGSRAKRGAGADYDIAVSFTPKSALELGGLLVDIAKALEVPESQVDLLHLESAPQPLLYTVLVEGVLIYGDREEATTFLHRRYLEMLDRAGAPP